MNIVTSICVDEEVRDESIIYPSTLGAKKEKRKEIYWKCAVVLLASAKRCNPTDHLILYTNDTKPVIIDRVDVRNFLKDLGVEIRHLPFVHYKPPHGYSSSFQNAFYKLDVIKALGDLKNTQSILLDSDCIWIKSNPKFNALIKSDGEVLLYDVYNSKNMGRNFHYEKRVGLGKLFKKINADYPVDKPIQFGGEVIAGSDKSFRIISERLKEVFDHIIKNFKEDELIFLRDFSIFDGDEYLAAYVFNDMPVEWASANPYLRRIWNTFKFSTARESDLNLTIWHMPFEKTLGIPLLYKEIIRTDSIFWNIPLDKFQYYLGKFLGVPKPVVMKRIPILTSKFFQMSFSKIKRMVNT